MMSARGYGICAGTWAKCDWMGRKVCIRFGICKKYNILWGYQDISGYGESSAEKRWH